MPVRISPSAVYFPEDKALCSKTVQFENVSDGFITYKIKTNVPNSYLVRPSCGILNPRATCEIQLVLKGNIEGVKATSSDRFMVLTKEIEAGDATNLPNKLWETPSDNTKKQMIVCAIAGDRSAGLSSSTLNNSSMYQSVVHSDITENLRIQSEEQRKKLNILRRQNKTLLESEQNLQGDIQAASHSLRSLEGQLLQYQPGNAPPGPLATIQTQVIIALVGFLLGVLTKLSF